ncbi:hypothetical protein SAMN04489841_2424 [Natrinema salaciae]|uniref:Uncharacterized protein n=1 Tax=Natrinema salaciae TaxID=1186196 RepID=A0A1H9J358_9EURY|nr:hypothetical protein SAMN04489841_2424 [Natrinema salaciae]
MIGARGGGACRARESCDPVGARAGRTRGRNGERGGRTRVRVGAGASRRERRRRASNRRGRRCRFERGRGRRRPRSPLRRAAYTLRARVRNAGLLARPVRRHRSRVRRFRERSARSRRAVPTPSGLSAESSASVTALEHPTAVRRGRFGHGVRAGRFRRRRRLLGTGRPQTTLEPQYNRFGARPSRPRTDPEKRNRISIYVMGAAVGSQARAAVN